MFERFLERTSNSYARHHPRRVADLRTERPIVSFTFDDAPETALSNGARIVEAHGGRATFYLTGGVVGQMHDGQRMLDENGCRELLARGHEIGHHGFRHARPLELGWGFKADMAENDAYLSSLTLAKPRNFAFPYGLTSPRAQRVAGHRFRSCRGIRGGVNRDATDLDYLASVEIRAHTTLAELIAWVDKAVDHPGWLTFFTHDVKPGPTVFGCPPELLEQLADYAVAKGCELLTVNAALDRLGVAP